MHIIGAGNSAGQAALFFSSHARTVTIVCRGDSLEKSMSQYLVEQVRRKPNITVELGAEVAAVHGDAKLEEIEIRERASGETARRECGGLFIFIGADADTTWLPAEIALDDRGYVLTGADARGPRRAGTTSAIRTSWRPACRASSPPATCASARSSGSRRRSARAAWRSPSCTSTCGSPERRGLEASRLPAMSYRDSLPLDDGALFLTDAGMETALIFHQGQELPSFATFPLLESEDGRAALRTYYEPFLELARTRGTGFILGGCTWRASADWGAELGYDREAMDAVNRRAIGFVEELRASAPASQGAVVLEAPIGPRGDAYAPETMMSAEEAERYHSAQMQTLSDTARRPDHGAHDHLRGGGDRHRARRARCRACRSRSRSPSRRTGACRAARRCAPRSSRSTPRRTERRSTT